tara:strand:+ start:1906 stop:3018 length:1113 start_codon:yes stop_codon:yes gene_type:complete
MQSTMRTTLVRITILSSVPINNCERTFHMENNKLTAVPVYHNNLAEIVKGHLATKIPMCIWSPPGCGKTDHMRQIAVEAGFAIIDWRLAQMDAADVRGIPYIGDDGRTHYAPPATLPVEGCGPTVLFLDEIMQAHGSVTAVAGQIIHERRLGDYVLPDNVVVFAASNRHFDRAAANRMAAHTANRFLHYELVVNSHDWCEWAVANRVDERVVSFLRWRPELCYQYDPKSTSPAYPSLRSWTHLASIISAVDENSDIVRTYALGAVGEGAGSEFIGFIKTLRRLPDIDEIIANPDDHDDPEESDLRHGITGAMARRADEDNVENIWKFMIKLPDDWQVLWAKDVMALGFFDITQHPVYAEVISLHREALTS